MFGEWLKAAMSTAGIRNQTELADLVGVTPSAVNTWVRNRRTPDIGLVGALARALRVPRLAVFQALGLVPRLDDEVLLQLADVLESVDAERAALIVQVMFAAQSLPVGVLQAKLEEFGILAEHYQRRASQSPGETES